MIKDMHIFKAFDDREKEVSAKYLKLIIEDLNEKIENRIVMEGLCQSRDL